MECDCLTCLNPFCTVIAFFCRSVCVFSHPLPLTLVFPCYTLVEPVIRYLLHSFCIKLFQLFFVCLSDVFDLKYVLRRYL